MVQNSGFYLNLMIYSQLYVISIIESMMIKVVYRDKREEFN